MEFYGGEPLMQQEHDRILNIMYEHGNPANTGLYYNTNSTIFKEHLFILWKPFKEVVVNFSIDDIKDRFEYQRYNAKWEETLTNIKQYRQYSKAIGVNMDLRVYATVGILNVYYLKEFFEELKGLGVLVTLNLVHYPHHYAIVNLPTLVKDIVKEKLKSIDTDLVHSHSLTINNIINFMYGNECNTSLLELFFVKTHQHDKYRGDSFETTFPELYELLKEYDT
jgi:sulfatase maturation enzyme AslB (radical SAM superfamily)